MVLGALAGAAVGTQCGFSYVKPVDKTHTLYGHSFTVNTGIDLCFAKGAKYLGDKSTRHHQPGWCILRWDLCKGSPGTGRSLELGLMIGGSKPKRG